MTINLRADKKADKQVWFTLRQYTCFCLSQGARIATNHAGGQEIVPEGEPTVRVTDAVKLSFIEVKEEQYGKSTTAEDAPQGRASTERFE